MDANTFSILYILTFVVVGIMMIIPVVLVVVLIIFLSKRSAKQNQQNKEMHEQVMERYKAKERLAQEELNLKKMQMKKVKCLYCGTYNLLTESYCVSCGASVSGTYENDGRK